MTWYDHFIPFLIRSHGDIYISESLRNRTWIVLLHRNVTSECCTNWRHWGESRGHYWLKFSIMWSCPCMMGRKSCLFPQDSSPKWVSPWIRLLKCWNIFYFYDKILASFRYDSFTDNISYGSWHHCGHVRFYVPQCVLRIKCCLYIPLAKINVHSVPRISKDLIHYNSE